MEAAPRDALAQAFRFQAAGCRHFGSELYARLLEACAEDAERGGPVARVCAGFRGDPLRGFLALRLLGAVHARVLAGRAPDLARFYPSVGGRPAWPDAWHAFRELLAGQGDVLGRGLAHFPQTNEVRRAAGILPALLVLAERTGLPLRLLEIGASAGLLLQLDRYRYALGPHRFGPPDSPVCIEAEWAGPPAPFGARLVVAGRAGCDIAPVDPRDPECALRLLGYVWADQVERFEPARAALALAREDPPRVVRARAGDWLPEALADGSEGVARVVFHSQVWIYLPPEEQRAVEAAIEAAGARATAKTPLAWLRHDDMDGTGRVDVVLRVWPPGETLRLARSHPHGRRVEWLEGAG